MLSASYTAPGICHTPWTLVFRSQLVGAIFGHAFWACILGFGYNTYGRLPLQCDTELTKGEPITKPAGCGPMHTLAIYRGLAWYRVWPDSSSNDRKQGHAVLAKIDQVVPVSAVVVAPETLHHTPAEERHCGLVNQERTGTSGRTISRCTPTPRAQQSNRTRNPHSGLTPRGTPGTHSAWGPCAPGSTHQTSG